MSAGGVFLAVDVSPGATTCSDSEVQPGLVQIREPVDLAGVPTALEAMAPGPGAQEVGWAVAASALVGGVCYHFSFITFDRHTLDATLPVARAVVGSFTLLGG
jgi:hypothetical protein